MKNKFTLIELLVVIAVIGVLASLLLPALGSARKTSQVAVCTNNLRQVNIAAMMFQEDNDGYYPPTGQSTGISWDDLLSSYDGRNLTQQEMTAGGVWGPRSTDFPDGADYGKLYRCPLDSRILVDNYDLKTYSHTPIYIWQPDTPIEDDWPLARGISGFVATTSAPRSLKASQINDTANAIAFTELDNIGM